MAKRVQCLDIWDKDWFIYLDDHYKLFYQYVEDNCNEAGIWAPQKARFEGLLKQKKQIDYYKFLENVNADTTRIVILKNGNWLIKNYFSERQGTRMNIHRQGFHRKVIRELIFHEALQEVEGIMNLDEAVRDLKAFDAEQKRKSKEKLKASLGIHIEDEESEISTPPAAETNTAAVIEERKLKIDGRAETGHFPEICYVWDGSRQAHEIEKFIREENFEVFCKIEKITDPVLLKHVLEYFIGKVTKEATKTKYQSATQLKVYFNNWYKAVKSNENFLLKLLPKETSSSKIPKFRKANPEPPT